MTSNLDSFHLLEGIRLNPEVNPQLFDRIRRELAREGFSVVDHRDPLTREPFMITGEPDGRTRTSTEG